MLRLPIENTSDREEKIMAEWQTVRLGEIVKTNQSTYSPKENWQFVNYLDTGNITMNKIDEIQYINTAKDKLPSRARRKVKTNSIIYSTVRPNQLHYGIIKEQPDNFLVSTGFTVIDVNYDKGVPDFIYYALTKQEVTEQLQAIAEQSVSAYPSLKPSDIENLELMLPDKKTQERIVAILRSIDEKIKENNAINNNLDASALAIYRKYFVEGIKPDDLPLGWSMGTLKDIYQFQYGKGNTNPDNGGQYPIYGSNGVIGGYHEYNNENEPVIGHIGAAGSLNFAFGKHYVTYNGIMCNILVPRNIYFGYLTLYAQNLAAQVRGSTQPFISYDMLYEVKTVLPTDEVLDDFHSKISPIMEHKREILSEITKLEQMQIIMQEQLSSF